MSYRIIIGYILTVLTAFSNAGLEPMTDEQMSDTTGQAFIQFDRTENVNNLDFTKITFGLDVETSLNSDLVELGNYRRDGQDGADIRIRDFALGSVNDDGSINPFEIQDPFIEVAFDKSGGKQNVVGVRLGFGGARGQLSGTIESLTGNVNVDIRDTAAGLQESGNFLGGLAAVLLNDAPISTAAKLVDENGNEDRVRASSIGLPNDFKLSIQANDVNQRSALNIIDILPNTECVQRGGFLNIGCARLEISANDCASLGINVCFDLKKYNTLDVGQKRSDGGFDVARGLFLSFQSDAITWSDGASTEKGAFLNVPNGGLEVTLAEAFNGTRRIRTKMLDPYYD